MFGGLLIYFNVLIIPYYKYSLYSYCYSCPCINKQITK